MFEKAVALNPDDTQTMINLADAYRGSWRSSDGPSAFLEEKLHYYNQENIPTCSELEFGTQASR